MRLLAAACLPIIAGALACGMDPPSGGLDCAWLAGDNCWKMTAIQAASCLPQSSDMGTFSADHRMCTYASGAAVTFDSAVPLPITGGFPWRFTVTNGGAECLHYETDGTTRGFLLTVNGQTVRWTADGVGLTVTCPDGSSVSSPSISSLLACSPGGIPADSWAASNSDVGFSLINVGLGGDDSLSVFSCAAPS